MHIAERQASPPWASSARHQPPRQTPRSYLRFKLTRDDELPVTSMVNAYRAFHERALLASIQVAFTGERPTVIWTYERLSHFAQPGSPTATNKVEPGEDGIVSLRLRDVHGGLVSGIAWEW